VIIELIKNIQERWLNLLICPECGHVNRKYAGFCEECLADLRYLSDKNYTKNKGGLNSNLLFTVVLLVITLLVLFFVYNFLLANLI
jgi:hypothetical protein